MRWAAVRHTANFYTIFGKKRIGTDMPERIGRVLGHRAVKDDLVNGRYNTTLQDRSIRTRKGFS